MKKFHKQSTIQALENANIDLAEAKKVLEDAMNDVINNNSRANRKAVRRAEMNLQQANARVYHIEVALGYQSENHNKTMRKPQVGDVMHKPTEIEKSVSKMEKSIAADKARKSESAKSMADAMDEYARKCIWAQEKSDKAEAKRIKREAEKAARAALRKAEIEQKAAEKAAEKAAKKEAYVERLEAQQSFALGYLPQEAEALVKELENYNSLVATAAEQYEVLWDKKLELREKGKEAKAKVVELSAGLKRPMCSAKVREAMAVKAEIEAQINAVTKECSAAHKKGVAFAAERKAIVKQINLLKKHGNAAVRPTIRSAMADLRRAEKVKKIDEAIRVIQTVEERCKKDRFQIPSWNAETVLRANGLDKLFKSANAYRTGMKNGAEAEAAFDESLEAIEKLNEMIDNEVPLKLNLAESRPSALQMNMLAMCMRIDPEAKGIRDEWISVEHKFFTTLKPSWKLFSSNKKEGLKLASEFVDRVATLLDKVLVYRPGETKAVMYNGLYSSASHQKKEKLISCKEELMKLHETIVWFGLTKEHVLATDITGSEIWKKRANLARPIAFAVNLKDGTPIYLHNIKMVPDPKKNYSVKNGLFIGKGKNGQCYEYRDDSVAVKMGDGEALAIVEMERDAFQGGGTGVKMMCAYAEDALYEAERKRSKKALIEDGKYIICGDGCFKFDKLYNSFDEFAARMDALAERYPGINRVYALRESEELEGDDKIRRVSRSLLQQLIVASDAELNELVTPTVNSLCYKKTFEGIFASLAELGIPADKRSAFARLVFECPELITNPIVQRIAERSWTAKKREAMGNKFRVDGQYPYILQDPVALFEVWLLGVDPDDPDLGVLKAGEASVVGVPEGKKMVAIRYPANFFTAKTVVCKPMKELFGRCGNVAILSVHDDILIIQDGDVDGDEAGFFYNELLVELVERMIRVVKPPVVIFEHDGKVKRSVIGSEKELIHRMYASLHASKEFDSVGRYANLARDCAYLCRIALRLGKQAMDAGDYVEAKKQDALYRKYILWMAAASTGAIFAIDQVKGVAVDENLIGWLDKIEEVVRNIMTKDVVEIKDGEPVIKKKYAAPFTQPFVKDDDSIDTLDPNMLVGTDELAMFVNTTAGSWGITDNEFYTNNWKLAELITDDRHVTTPVRQAVVTTGVLTELRVNYFNRKTKKVTAKGEEEVDCDKKIMGLIAQKKPVGQKDLLLMYWRNACTLEFRMQEKTIPGRKAAYCKMVHDSLISQALSTPWFASEFTPGYEVGHEFTDEEKVTAVVNNAVIDALELGTKGNGVDEDSKASYTKFVLSVFADELIDNVRRNRHNVDIRNFMMSDIEYKAYQDAEFEETDFDALVEYEVEYNYYDDGRRSFDNLTDEEIERMAPPEDDYENALFCEPIF